jgi:hypothetical protein
MQDDRTALQPSAPKLAGHFDDPYVQALRPEVRRRLDQPPLDDIELFRSMLEEGMSSGEFRRIDAGLHTNFVPLLCAVRSLRNGAIGQRDVTVVRDAIIDPMVHALAPAAARRRAS